MSGTWTQNDGLVSGGAEGEYGEMLRYALVALPGSGDAVIRSSIEAGAPPEVVIHAGADDFSWSGLPRMVAGNGWEEALASRGLDALVVANWERCLSESLLERFPLGGWNLHPSLLPLWRGHNPYFHVLAHGERETGVTVHRLTSQLDRGPILLQKTLTIDPEETLGTLWRRLSDLAAVAWIEAMPMIASGNPRLVEQPEGEFPIAATVKPTDLELHPERTLEEALRLVRAANPFYGVTAVIAGRPTRIFAAIPGGDAASGASAGGLVQPRGPLVKCRDGYLCATVLDVDGVGVIAGECWSTYIREAL